ncbi:MAG: matrixin family metalloprotease [Proteobacteria bacterium]|nr:matrixin family metalloprotease [Pseudomonadota bacterium]
MAESVAWSTDKVNSSNRSIYGDDLETISLHELGHVLGLGHTTVSGAVMNATRMTKTVRELSQDDIEGGQYLASVTGGGATGSGSSANASHTAGCGSITNNNAKSNSSNIGGMGAMMLLP